MLVFYMISLVFSVFYLTHIPLFPFRLSSFLIASFFSLLLALIDRKADMQTVCSLPCQTMHLFRLIDIPLFMYRHYGMVYAKAECGLDRIETKTQHAMTQ